MGKQVVTKTKTKGDIPVEGIPSALANFDQLPDSAFVRLPVVCALRGCSAASVWRHVKAGLVPAPQKLSPGITAFNVGKLRAFMAEGR